VAEHRGREEGDGERRHERLNDHGTLQLTFQPFVAPATARVQGWFLRHSGFALSGARGMTVSDPRLLAIRP